MHAIVRAAAVLLPLAFTAGCSSPGPASPTDTRQPPVVASPLPSPPTDLPPLSGPSRTFTFASALSYPVSAFTKESRLVLYENGAFALQYVKLGFEYRGKYSEANGVVTFEWKDSNYSAPWGATGTVKDGTLTVRYNVSMQLSDFEDAVYALIP